MSICANLWSKKTSVVCRDGAGVRSLIRFCRDYMPYLFIGVIGLEVLLQYQEVLPSECVLALRVISYLYIDGSGTCPLTLSGTCPLTLCSQ